MRGYHITKDLINTGEELRYSRKGMRFEASSGEVLPEGPAIRFRLFDDDGELYYEGTLGDDPDCMNQMHALDFGAWDAGCTYIEVRRDGKWIQEIA